MALETLKIYDEIDIVGRVRRIGPVLQEGIRRFAGHALAGEIAGEGMLAVIELVADKEIHEPFAPDLKAGASLVAHAQAYGLIVRALGDRIAFAPPLVMTPEEIDEMFARFARALDDTAAGLESKL